MPRVGSSMPPAMRSSVVDYVEDALCAAGMLPELDGDEAEAATGS